MVRVEKARGPRVVVRGIGEFSVGDVADVSADDAEYLVEERGGFEYADDDPGTNEDAADDADEAGGQVAEPPLNPAEFSVDALREALGEGEYSDAELDAIAEAERADGSPRTTALDAIDAARED